MKDKTDWKKLLRGNIMLVVEDEYIRNWIKQRTPNRGLIEAIVAAMKTFKLNILIKTTGETNCERIKTLEKTIEDFADAVLGVILESPYWFDEEGPICVFCENAIGEGLDHKKHCKWMVLEGAYNALAQENGGPD